MLIPARMIGITLMLLALPAEAYIAMPAPMRCRERSTSGLCLSKVGILSSKRAPSLVPRSLVATTMVEKEDKKWKDPPKEVLDDAIERAVTLVKASGGSMDSISFGAAWKVAYPTYDRKVFEGTTVTSFTKLLQVRRVCKIYAQYKFVTTDAKRALEASELHCTDAISRKPGSCFSSSFMCHE
jgi:hypothetical protein